MTSLIPGARLGPYEILGPLGAGGMGEVHRARDTRLGRDVALKVLPPLIASNSDRLARFQREAQVLASLNHPNVGAIYGLEDAGGSPALVLELVEGPTLADRIARGAMPADEAIAVARQIAEGMEYAHDRGVVHRDLKPANVKLDPEGRVKILDFGLAKAVAGDPLSSQADPALSPTLTSLGSMAGAIIGTAAYMSPEQARGSSVDRRADIWAFGAVLYEMLTARRAFEGETISDTLASVLRAPVEWEALPASTPPGVLALLRRCLERDPKKRLRDIGEARIILENPAGGVAEAGAAAPAAAAAVAAPRSPLARLLPWALVAVAAVVLLFVALRRPAPKEAPRVTRFEVGPTGELASMRWPRLSPDGRLLAFQGRDAAGKAAVWIRPLDSFAAYPLSGTENAGRPFWSPDSRYIAFFSGSQLMKVPVAGGPAQLICEAGSGSDGTWGAAGVILFDGGRTDPIRRCSASGGVVAEQARPDEKKGESTLAWPLFLPDGHHYLFVVDSTVAGKPRTMIHVGSIDEPGSKELAPTDTRVEYGSGYLVYAEQNTLVARKFDPQRLETIGDPVPLAKGVASSAPGYFSASAAGVLAYMTAGSGGNSLLTWIDREGKELGKEGPPGEYRDLALSPDGTRLAYGLSDGRQEDLWVRDLRRGVAMRLTSDPKDDAWPTWSPDGSRIWFTSNRAGVFSLMQKSSSGTGAEELLYSKEGTNLGPDDASADGRWIALGMFPLGAPPDIFVMPTQGPREPKPFLTERAVERTPAFSPDGRWVAYMSNETGKSEIYVQPFPATGAKWTVSTGGGNTPRWRGDGKELFYLGPDDTLYAVPVTLGASFDAGQPKALFRRRTEKSGIVRNRYVVTADGKRFLINGGEEDRGATPFSVVLNWPQGLAGE